MRPINQRARVVVAIVLAAVTLVTVIAPAAAAAPKPVTIDVVNTFADGPPFGTFTASGSAVDSGLICPSGATLDPLDLFAGGQSGRKLQILVLKQFTCDDGSGTFLIKMQVHIDFATGETFTWVVLNGTGDYEHLNGGGPGATLSLPDDDDGGHNENIYTGFLIG